MFESESLTYILGILVFYFFCKWKATLSYCKIVIGLTKNGIKSFFATSDIFSNFFSFIELNISTKSLSIWKINPWLSTHNLLNYFITNSLVIKFIEHIFANKQVFYLNNTSWNYIILFCLATCPNVTND